MSLSTFNTNQSQSDRQIARQQQLDMMEAAASGKHYTSAPSPAGSAHSHRSQQPPEGAIENARRFLWDEEDVQVVNLMGRNDVPSYPSNHQPASMTERLTSIMPNMPRFAARTGVESGVPVNLAPRRQDAWSAHGDAQSRSTDSEEYMEGHYRENGILSCVGDFFLAIFHTFVGICAILMECVTGCLSEVSPKLMAGLCCGSLGLGLFIFGIVAVVHRTTTERIQSAMPIEDEVRYHAIRNNILASKFTSQDHLDAQGTAQNLALRWMTDFDPAQLATDHEALLQRYALATFYFSTYLNAELHDQGVSEVEKEGGWTLKDNWMTEKGICAWYGVTCPQQLHEGKQLDHYNENSDILKLNLTANNVAGTIPSELAALENLVSLDLGMNIISGSIPKELFDMQLLTSLYLEENQLTGTIHTEIGSLVAMRDLFLGTNKLFGKIPSQLGLLTELRALGLDENFLTGSIPNLWACSNLLILYLDENELEGTIPPEIEKLKNIVDLRLRKNSLSGRIPDTIQNLVHMELFYVDDNDLTGTIPDIWDKTPRVQEIQIYKNKIDGTFPESFSTLKDLRVVYADNNALVGTLPTTYGTLNDLETFFAFNNKLEGKIPTEYGNMDNMRDFEVYSNKLTGEIPTELGNNFKLLKLLVHDNGLSGPVPTELGQLESLEMLKLYQNKLTGTLPSSVCHLKDKFDLTFVAVDCNMEKGGSIVCPGDCCNACYPS